MREEKGRGRTSSTTSRSWGHPPRPRLLREGEGTAYEDEMPRMQSRPRLCCMHTVTPVAEGIGMQLPDRNHIRIQRKWRVSKGDALRDNQLDEMARRKCVINVSMSIVVRDLPCANAKRHTDIRRESRVKPDKFRS